MINYPIEHKVQASITDYCKSLVNDKKYIGNPIALSQKISSLVAIGLLTVQQRKIYDCLTDKPKDTITIAHEAKLPQVQVINQLRQINKMTRLISHVIEGRNKLWTKA